MTPFPGFWRTRDGRFMLITDMSDDHLMNTLFMLRRMFAESQRRDQEAASRSDDPALSILIGAVDPEIGRAHV